MPTIRFFFACFAPLVAALALGACAGHDGPDVTAFSAEPADVAIDGAWTGTWLSATGAGGTTSSTFVREGARVTGDLRFTGSPCFGGGRFEGTLNGSRLTGALTAGAIRVDLDATVSRSAIDGTYETISAGACTGDHGTFSSSR